MHGEEREGLSEGGKGVRPNRLADGEGHWNGVGGVEDAGRWEDGWGVGDEGSSLGELDNMGRGEAARQEDK